MTPYVLVLLILGVFLIVGFVLWEIHFEHPLLPMHIWKDRDFSLIIFILFLSFLAFPESLFWMTLYIQRYWTGSALHVALYVLPAAVVGALVNVSHDRFHQIELFSLSATPSASPLAEHSTRSSRELSFTSSPTSSSWAAVVSYS